MDKPIPFLSQWATEDETVGSRIYIKDLTNKDDVVRACLLVAIGKPYKSLTLKVTV